MQSAKDSFYMALRQRLSAVNAARVITLDGQSQPAIVMSDAQPVLAADMPSECFCLSFGTAAVARGFERAPQPLHALDCSISYVTGGASLDGSDRGRMLSTLDVELLQICVPPSTPILDYTQSPPKLLGRTAFWLRPKLSATEDTDGLIRRTATLKLFFAPEVNA